MPDYFSSSLGLFLGLSPSPSPPLFSYARRIENNSATDGRRHARPCPTRLRIHFICARGEWIKINDGRTFIAFRGEGGIGEERHKLRSATRVSYWARLADSLISTGIQRWHKEWRQCEDNKIICHRAEFESVCLRADQAPVRVERSTADHMLPVSPDRRLHIPAHQIWTGGQILFCYIYFTYMDPVLCIVSFKTKTLLMLEIVLWLLHT